MTCSLSGSLHTTGRVTFGYFWPHPGQLHPANWPVTCHHNMKLHENVPQSFHQCWVDCPFLIRLTHLWTWPQSWAACVTALMYSLPPQYQQVSALRITRPSSLYQPVFSARSNSQPVQQMLFSEAKLGLLHMAAPRAPNWEYNVTLIFRKKNYILGMTKLIHLLNEFFLVLTRICP